MTREERGDVWIDPPSRAHKEPTCTCGEAWAGHPNPHASTCRRHIRPRARLASEMPGWVGSEPPPDVLTEDDSWDRWPA